jgi:hypothetical protein
MSDEKKGSWVYVGKRLEADVYKNLDTGETAHIGTTIRNGNSRELYRGEPSLKGYIAGKIVQSILGTTRDD